MSKRKTQKLLEVELEQIQKTSKLGFNLKVTWTPVTHNRLSGEVKSEMIFIYESEEGEALKTLRHEFIDYCICQAIEPYKKVTNRLIKMINEDAYKRKEKIVEALTRLIIG